MTAPALHTRAARIDAAVEKTAERLSLHCLESRSFLKLWLEEPDYMIPLRCIREEFARQADKQGEAA